MLIIFLIFSCSFDLLHLTWTIYPTETDKKTMTSMTVDRTVDRVSELFRVRLDEEAIPSIALAAAAAVVESIFRVSHF